MQILCLPPPPSADLPSAAVAANDAAQVDAVPKSPRPNDSELYNAIRNRVRNEVRRRRAAACADCLCTWGERVLRFDAINVTLFDVTASECRDGSERFPAPRPSQLFGGKKHGAHRAGGNLAAATILGSAALAYCIYAAVPSFLSGMLLGVTGAWIGLTVQHCANHGAMSNSVIANKLLGVTDDLIGGSSLMWRYHHQVSHHIHCNDNALDEDVFSAFPLIRFDARLPRMWHHQFQHLYMWALFPFMLLTFHLGDLQGMTRKETSGTKLHGASLFELATVALGKAAHFGLIIAPMMVHGWQAVLFGYAGYLTSLGIVLSSTFAVSHNVPEAKQDTETSGDAAGRDWGRQQLMTSANWGGVVGNFFTGGLNLQIEHHLFPAICFVHYPAISKIVREEATKRGLVYQAYATLPQIMVKFAQYMKEVGSAEQRPMERRLDLTAVDTGATGRFTPMPGQAGCPVRLIM